MTKADLLQAMREKANSTVAPATAGTAKRTTGGVGPPAPPPSRAGKRQVAAYFPVPVQKQLKLLMVENDTTVQNLLAEALNDLFAKYGKPEIAPRAAHMGRRPGG